MDCSMFTAVEASDEPEPVPPNSGLVEAQPNTLSFVALARGSMPSFFRSTMPSSPTFLTVALLWATVSSLSSALEAFRKPETLLYMGPKQMALTITAMAAMPASADTQRTTWRLPFLALWATNIITMTASRISSTAHT